MEEKFIDFEADGRKHEEEGDRQESMARASENRKAYGDAMQYHANACEEYDLARSCYHEGMIKAGAKHLYGRFCVVDDKRGTCLLSAQDAKQHLLERQKVKKEKTDLVK